MRAGPVSLLLFNPNSPSVTMATATSHRLSGAAGWPLEDPITLTNGSGARGGNTGCTQGFLSLCWELLLRLRRCFRDQENKGQSRGKAEVWQAQGSRHWHQHWGWYRGVLLNLALREGLGEVSV